MGCMFQDMDVTSCFDGQSSSYRIFFFEISHRCDPRGLCQEDVPANPLVELLKLTGPLGKPGMRVVLQEPALRSGIALRCLLGAVLSPTARFLSCINLFQPSEHRLAGALHRFKMLLLGKGVILFLCMLCCDCGCEISVREPTHLPEDYYYYYYFYGVIFQLDPIPGLSRDCCCQHYTYSQGCPLRTVQTGILSFLGLHNCTLGCSRVYWQTHTRVGSARLCSQTHTVVSISPWDHFCQLPPLLLHRQILEVDFGFPRVSQEDCGS